MGLTVMGRRISRMCSCGFGDWDAHISDKEWLDLGIIRGISRRSLISLFLFCFVLCFFALSALHASRGLRREHLWSFGSFCLFSAADGNCRFRCLPRFWQDTKWCSVWRTGGWVVGLIRTVLDYPTGSSVRNA